MELFRGTKWNIVKVIFLFFFFFSLRCPTFFDCFVAFHSFIFLSIQMKWAHAWINTCYWSFMCICFAEWIASCASSKSGPVFQTRPQILCFSLFAELFWGSMTAEGIELHFKEIKPMIVSELPKMPRDLTRGRRRSLREHESEWASWKESIKPQMGLLQR